MMEYLQSIPKEWDTIPKHFQVWLGFFLHIEVAVSDKGEIVYVGTWERFRESHLKILLKQEYKKAQEIGYVDSNFYTKQLEREISKFLQYFRTACDRMICSGVHKEYTVEKDINDLDFIK